MQIDNISQYIFNTVDGPVNGWFYGVRIVDSDPNVGTYTVYGDSLFQICESLWSISRYVS